MQAAPKFQWTVGTGKVFKYLSPESKDKVFRRFMDWFEEARQRGADFYGMEPDTTDLGEMEGDCLLAMCEDSADGLDNFWARTAPEPPEAEPPPDKGGDTGGRSQAASGSVRQPETAPDSARSSQAANNLSIYQSTNRPINQSIKLFPTPALEEVEEYCKQQQLSFDPQKFFSYYETVGWIVKGQPMRDWKAAARVWEMNERKEGMNHVGKSMDMAGISGPESVNAEVELYGKSF